MATLLFKEQGQSLVEVALVIPLLFIFLLGLWQFLILFQAKVVLEHYSFELARVAATHSGSLKEAKPVFNRLKQALTLSTGGTSISITTKLLRKNLTINVKLTSKVKLLPGLAVLSRVFGQNFVTISAGSLFIKEPYLNED